MDVYPAADTDRDRALAQKIARWPSRWAAARAISRVITAWSAAVSAGCGRDRHLELARPVFGEEAVRHRPGRAQCGDKGFAETALAAERAKRIGVARALLDAGIDELLLEGGDDAQP